MRERLADADRLMDETGLSTRFNTQKWYSQAIYRSKSRTRRSIARAFELYPHCRIEGKIKERDFYLYFYPHDGSAPFMTELFLWLE